MKKDSSPFAFQLGMLIFLFLLWNCGLSFFHGWVTLWWLGLLVDFLLIVGIAELIGKMIPSFYAPLYRRSLSVSFPLLLFLAWELLVRGGVLSPDWFPPPRVLCRPSGNYSQSSTSFRKPASWVGRGSCRVR